MFEKLTESRMRLSEEHRRVLAAMLITLRCECLNGISAATDMDNEWTSRQITGSAVNYKAQIQALDRIILRLGQSWDIRKLSQSVSIYELAVGLSLGRRMNSDDLDKASKTYGVGGFASGPDRIEGQGHGAISGEEGHISGRPHSSGTGGTGDDPEYVDARSDRH